MRNYHETNGDTFLTASAAASSVHLLNLMMDIVIVGSGTSCVGGKVLVLTVAERNFLCCSLPFFNPFFLFLITSGLRVVLFCGDGGGGVVFFTSHWLSPLTIDLEN